jgi:hypothetical protein
MGGLAMDLSRLLGHPVDVVTEAGLRERIRSRVLREARPYERRSRTDTGYSRGCRTD